MNMRKRLTPEGIDRVTQWLLGSAIQKSCGYACDCRYFVAEDGKIISHCSLKDCKHCKDRE